jgi:hypothetical protein
LAFGKDKKVRKTVQLIPIIILEHATNAIEIPEQKLEYNQRKIGLESRYSSVT